jgi:uncharacterized alkaline shock family protein YloU
MAEDTNIILTGHDDEGTIEIAPEVVEVILGIAAVGVDGVYQMRGTLASSINQLFGRENRGKGVALHVADGRLSADVYVYLNYGVSVPKVALDMQETLREQLLFMTDLDLTEVNVHVVGVVPEKVAKIDTKDLFEDTEDDE